MQRIRMEALGLPGASDIHVHNMPPQTSGLFLSPPTRRSSPFAPTTPRCRLLRWSFYAITGNEHYPSHWLPAGVDASVRRESRGMVATERPFAPTPECASNIRHEIPHGEIIELNDVQHYVFLETQPMKSQPKRARFCLNHIAVT